MPTSRSNGHGDSVESRVTTLEVTMNSLAKDLAETTQSVKDLTNLVHSGFEKLHSATQDNRSFFQNQIGNLQTKFQTTNWPLILGILTLAGSAIAFVLKPLEKDVYYAEKIETMRQQYLEDKINTVKDIYKERDDYIEELIRRDYEKFHNITSK